MYARNAPPRSTGRLQHDATQLVHAQHETYGGATCVECVEKRFRLDDRIVLAGQRIGPKRALTAKPIRGSRRRSG